MYKIISSNIRRTYFYLFLIFILILAVGYLLGLLLGNRYFFIGAVIFALIYNLLAYYYGDKIVLKVNKAREVSKSERNLYNKVENISIQLGLPMPKVYIIEDEMPNAFATGRDPKHSSIAVTRGLLELMDSKELEGVLAHEFSHIRNYDIRLATIVAVLVGVILMIADYLGRALWFSDERENGGNIIKFAVLIFILIIAPVAAQLIQLAISRRREFLADASSVEITRYPQGLISALKKISQFEGKMKNVSPSTAHLFFSSPFGPREKTGFLEKLFSTHPPIEERIKNLEKMGF